MAAFLRCLVSALILRAALCNTLRDTLSTSCDVVVEGASRKLTCRFDVDLNKTKLDCTVQKYTLDPTDRNPDRVVSCNWKPTDELSCHAYGSYKLNGTVTDTVVIDLPETEREGRYLCQIITNVQKRQTFCTFTQPGGNSVSRPNFDDLIPQNTDTTTHESTQSAERTSTVDVVVGVTVPTALVTLTVLVVVLVWRCRKDALKKSQTKPQGLTPYLLGQTDPLLKDKKDITKNSLEDFNKNHLTEVRC